MKQGIFAILILIVGVIVAFKIPTQPTMDETENKSKDDRPNIVVILADDLGYNDLGFTGSKDVKTPVLDALAKDGMIFKNGYVTHPYCGPSRAGILTGRYQARFGMESNLDHTPSDPHHGIPVGEKIFAERLKNVGYKTGIVGKWHLGSHNNFHPLNRGFDYFYGFLGGGHDYFPNSIEMGIDPYRVPMQENKKVGRFEHYLTTEISQHGAKFIKENKENPYLLFVAYNAPHGPLQAPQEILDKYAHIEDNDRRTYLAMVDAMDQGVGILVDAIKANGDFDNTLIFFLSDNGGPFPESWCPDLDYASNYPFRRGKVALTEGGIHVPFIAHWPDKIKKGITFDGLVSALDIAATSVAISGAKKDALLEGVNLVPYWNGDKKGSPHQALFWRLFEQDNLWAVRTEEYKYFHQPLPNVGLSFFDIKDDPYEKENLVGKRPNQQEELAKLWNEWNTKNINNIHPPYYEYKGLIKKQYDSFNEDLVKAARDRKPYVVE
ncbi:MAG: sulfatase-like hydrolase/transferase [Bacteroidota bacterium]